jgi:acyl-CoA dehydrogenase
MLDRADDMRSARSPTGAAFLDEVRSFLSKALTPDLREAGRNTIGVHSDIEACRIWHRRLFEKGWIAPAWPIEYGGTNWTPAQRLTFERECAANDAPVLFAGGLRSLGPLLIAMGAPEQKRRYLSAILDGSDLWCQGFSEPGAGSDLAALQSRAVAKGDHYVVNGSKVWTTGAHIANRMFCLVRTSSGAKPQLGITFLLVDMASPGVTVRPIRTLDGGHEFNEVFLKDVRVPLANRVGEENEGWAVAKRLMAFARANNTTSGLLRRAFRRADEIIAAHGGADAGALRLQLCELECRVKSFEALELRTLTAGQTDGVSSEQASMIKTLATELHQDIATLTLEAAGPVAVANPDGDAGPFRWLGAGRFAGAKYLATRAASIYSGTNETHRNLLARRLLES